MAKTTGGPAFPVGRDGFFPPDSDAGKPKPGMSLRDHFASVALQGLLAGTLADGSDLDRGSVEMLSRAAYKFADALLKVREEQ